MDLYKQKKLVNLISQVDDLRKGFRMVQGIIPVRRNQSKEFNDWKAEVMLLLFNHEASSNIVDITKRMNGYNDEEDFEKIVSHLNALKNEIDSIDINNDHYFDYDVFLKDIIYACNSLQDNKMICENGSEDDITSYLRDLLDSKNYRVLDQTRRGKSNTGKQPGEIDLLIKNEENNPVTIIEALKLDCMSKTNIDRHVNKIFGYDPHGLGKNFILIYSYARDFYSFFDDYKKYISDKEFKYNLSYIREIEDIEYSEIKLLESKYNRSGRELILLHLFVNLNNYV
ncbi:hypothetical protein [Metaclostridioides mangenotii]|uniref:hypothetical protein n=1 Tax=Metaclostridioides mangenotii TaxID=1540 RepID=UPI0026F259E9|nr:hypothetical protein [Clostridioides mangenotii]